MKNLKLELGGIVVAAIFTTLILTVLFSGCTYNFAPEGDFIIDEIETRELLQSHCNYYIKDSDLVFMDSCGKWNIGDTITIKW